MVSATGDDMNSTTEGQTTTEAKDKSPRRPVEDWLHLGRGTYRLTLSCGHITERVGRARNGSIIELPPVTVTCYDCPRTTGAKTP
jgi:hypothetical protein